MHGRLYSIVPQACQSAQVQKALLQAETDNARLEKALLEAEATICEETKATARLDDELKEV